MDIGDDMFYPLGVKTDFSILKSLIKIEDYISYAKNNGLNVIGILDDNLNSSHIFYEMCKKNNIKPVIGLDIIIEDKEVYLYPVNYHGLTNLFKFFSLEEKSFKTLKNYSEDIICVINYESLEIYENMKKIFSKVFLLLVFIYNSSSLLDEIYMQISTFLNCTTVNRVNLYSFCPYAFSINSSSVLQLQPISPISNKKSTLGF